MAGVGLGWARRGWDGRGRGGAGRGGSAVSLSTYNQRDKMISQTTSLKHQLMAL